MVNLVVFCIMTTQTQGFSGCCGYANELCRMHVCVSPPPRQKHPQAAMPLLCCFLYHCLLLLLLLLLQIDLDALRELSWSGIPLELRPTCWKLLLGYLPPNK